MCTYNLRRRFVHSLMMTCFPPRSIIYTKSGRSLALGPVPGFLLFSFCFSLFASRFLPLCSEPNVSVIKLEKQEAWGRGYSKFKGNIPVATFGEATFLWISAFERDRWRRQCLYLEATQARLDQDSWSSTEKSIWDSRGNAGKKIEKMGGWLGARDAVPHIRDGAGHQSTEYKSTANNVH